MWNYGNSYNNNCGFTNNCGCCNKCQCHQDKKFICKCHEVEEKCYNQNDCQKSNYGNYNY